jgi:hypothetical protein
VKSERHQSRLVQDQEMAYILGIYAVFKVFYYYYSLKYEYGWNADFSSSFFPPHFNGDI